jgi:hypothetical protein
MQELLIGDPAPGIRIAEFLKGTPIIGSRAWPSLCPRILGQFASPRSPSSPSMITSMLESCYLSKQRS